LALRLPKFAMRVKSRRLKNGYLPQTCFEFQPLGGKRKEKKNWRFHQLNDQMNHANNIPCQTSEGFILVFKDQNLGFS